MSVAELQELEEIKGLVNRGQQLGVLTYSEIAGAVSKLDLDEVERLMAIPAAGITQVLIQEWWAARHGTVPPPLVQEPASEP